MANKLIKAPYNESGRTDLYVIFCRPADAYMLSNADGTFAAAPASYPVLAEHAQRKQTYELQITGALGDGIHPYEVYAPASTGVQDPTVDDHIYSDEMRIENDQEITLDGSIASVLGSGDTAVDHNTAADGSTVADSMRVLSDGLPVDGAVIDIYQCTLVQYNAGSRGTLQARSETKADGRWLRPVYLDGGLTYTVVFYKQGAFQAYAVQVVLP